MHSLKYIFPYLQKNIKRTLILYESELEDDELSRILNILNYPFFALGFPKNKLSISGLINAIEKSSDTRN